MVHRVLLGGRAAQRQGSPSLASLASRCLWRRLLDAVPLYTSSCGARRSPRPEHRRARRRGRDRHERGKRLGEAGPLSQREETQTDSATCRNDTKLPHTWAQVIVACAGVSIAHIGSDTPLLLCQEERRTSTTLSWVV